jgi:gag-polypeptide of LTR copia-type
MVFRGMLKKPDAEEELLNHSAWVFNNCFTQLMLRKYIKDLQMQYITENSNAHDIWTALCQIYNAKGFGSTATALCTLTNAYTSENDNIKKHIKAMQHSWQQMHLYDHKMLMIDEDLFISLLLTSLPPSWKDFIHPFMGKHFAALRQALQAYNQHSDLTKYDLIGTLIEEACQHKAKATSMTKRETLLVQNASSNSPSLQSCIENQKNGGVGIRDSRVSMTVWEV